MYWIGLVVALAIAQADNSHQSHHSHQGARRRTGQLGIRAELQGPDGGAEVAFAGPLPQGATFATKYATTKWLSSVSGPAGGSYSIGLVVSMDNPCAKTLVGTPPLTLVKVTGVVNKSASSMMGSFLLLDSCEVIPAAPAGVPAPPPPAPAPDSNEVPTPAPQ